MKPILNIKEKRHKLPLFVPQGIMGSFDKPILPKKVIWTKNHYLPHVQDWSKYQPQVLHESPDHLEL